MRKRPPGIDGLTASTLQLPPGPWPTVLDCLCEWFPSVTRSQWMERMARGRVIDADGERMTPATPHRVGLEVHYYREVEDEPAIPFDEAVLHADVDLLVTDKPHFMPVTPAGGLVHETLLGRLTRRTGNHASIAANCASNPVCISLYKSELGASENYLRGSIKIAPRRSQPQPGICRTISARVRVGQRSGD